MRKLVLALTAASLAMPVATTSADAKSRHRHYYRGQKVCSHSGGTTGLIAGGVAGGLLGHAVLGGGPVGTLAGAAGGALAGRAIDRKNTASRRCYYR